MRFAVDTLRRGFSVIRMALVQLPLFLLLLLRRELLLVLFLVFLAALVAHAVPLCLVNPARTPRFELVGVLEGVPYRRPYSWKSRRPRY